MIEIRPHPTLDGILVRNDGWIFLPKKRGTAAHWTEGSINNHGYRTVGINYKIYLVHRLIAETFKPNPDNKPCVDHKNRNRLDNHADNLEWVTYSENNYNTPRNKPIGQRLCDLGEKEFNRRRLREWNKNNKERKLELTRKWRERKKTQELP